MLRLTKEAHMTERHAIKRKGFYKKNVNHPQYQIIKVEQHIQTCGKGKFKLFQFFHVFEILRHILYYLDNVK